MIKQTQIPAKHERKKEYFAQRKQNIYHRSISSCTTSSVILPSVDLYAYVNIVSTIDEMKRKLSPVNNAYIKSEPFVCTNCSVSENSSIFVTKSVFRAL